nr:NADAR family protein [Actinomadura atramentaria]
MDVQTLAEMQRRGERLKFLFFWGHQPPKNGGTGSGCLSQWYPSPFEVDGIAYATAEHFMMAEKARLFADEKTRARIIAATHPKEAKDLGRAVRPFDQATWESHRTDIVIRGNIAKFTQNPDMGDYLRTTGDRILVEASPRDRIWGIGLSASNPDAERVEAWRGRNLLGFALMETRKAC